jgi:hypothetical protein
MRGPGYVCRPAVVSEQLPMPLRRAAMRVIASVRTSGEHARLSRARWPESGRLRRLGVCEDASCRIIAPSRAPFVNGGRPPDDINGGRPSDHPGRDMTAVPKAAFRANYQRGANNHVPRRVMRGSRRDPGSWVGHGHRSGGLSKPLTSADSPAASRLPSWPCRFDPGHPLHVLTSSYSPMPSSARPWRCSCASLVPTPGLRWPPALTGACGTDEARPRSVPNLPTHRPLPFRVGPLDM